MKKIAVFASGNGGNFQAIAEACADGRIAAECALCVCDKPGARVTDRAANLGVPVLAFNPKDFGSKHEFETMIADRLDEAGVELVALAGYMRIIGPTLLERYGGRLINIHPALLPAFPGAHGIQDAFNYGVKVYGVTIHYVDNTIDGGKIIAQEALPYEGTDIDELEEKIHQIEHRLYIKTIDKLLK